MEKNSYIFFVFFFWGMIPYIASMGFFCIFTDPWRVDFNENPRIDLFFLGVDPLTFHFMGPQNLPKTASVNSPWRGASFPSKFPSINLCEVYPPQNQQQKPLKMDVGSNFGLFSGAMNVSFRETRARRMRVYSSPHRDVYITYLGFWIPVTKPLCATIGCRG